MLTSYVPYWPNQDQECTLSRRKHLFQLFITVSFLLLLSCSRSDEEPSADHTGRTLDYPATVHFLSSEGDTVRSIQAAIADTPQLRSAGLMDVHDLPADNGMLFIFEDEQPRSFWMANTPLGLDIIFVSADMKIVRIHRNTRPYSDREVVSDRPAKYVVETHAGYTLRHDIQEGMQITYER